MSTLTYIWTIIRIFLKVIALSTFVYYFVYSDTILVRVWAVIGTLYCTVLIRKNLRAINTDKD